MKRLLLLLFIPSTLAAENILYENVLQNNTEVKIYEHDKLGIQKPFPSKSLILKDVETSPKIEIYNHGIYGLKDYLPEQTIILPQQRKRLDFSVLEKE